MPKDKGTKMAGTRQKDAGRETYKKKIRKNEAF